MDLYPYQHLFFTTLGYDPLCPVFPEAATASAGFAASATQIADLPKDTHILLITGIASPIQMLTDLEEATGTRPMSLSFPDHHYFRKKDIRLINKTFADMPAPKLLVTTEKDAVRLALSEGFTQEVLQQLYVLPIRVEFMLDQQELFNENIIAYVQKYSRNGILDKGKDDVKS
jgi:tetraacyldisaccharide 4'-kinase